MVTIRPARVSDVPAVLPMVARECAFHEKMDPAKYGFLPDPAKKYERWLMARAEDPQSVFWVAARGNEGAEGGLAGFLVATTEMEIPIYHLKEYGFIHDVWVEPDYRNEGVARQMVMLAIERFREIGVDQVRLDVLAENEAAKGLFRECGFRPGTIEMLIEIKKDSK